MSYWYNMAGGKIMVEHSCGQVTYFDQYFKKYRCLHCGAFIETEKLIPCKLCGIQSHTHEENSLECLAVRVAKLEEKS